LYGAAGGDGIALAIAARMTSRSHRRRTDGESDQSLVERIARGDRDALGRLYDRYAPALLALALRVVANRADAENLLHDVFLEAWRSIGDYHPDRGSVRAWLCLRMRSRAIDRLRAVQRARVVAMSEPPEHPDRSSDPLLALDRDRVRWALGGLSKEQRAVIELGYFGGFSSSQIALRLTIPIGTVKSRVAAALSRLRGVLAADLRLSPEGPAG
jgi:RNA polymerase sigma-70 factor (ECF subfamily)